MNTVASNLPNGVEDLFGQQAQKQFEALLGAFNEVSEWVSKNFSEVDFTVEFNDDTQNPILPCLRIKTRLMTGSHMTSDRLLRKSELRITKEMFDDPLFMATYISKIVPTFKETITREVNGWYNKKKSINGH